MDWGVGGFGMVRALLRRSPKINLVYFSDSGFLPYGKVPARVLERRLLRVLESFVERGVRCAVVACNAASTVVPKLRPRLPEGLVVHEVIGPGVALVRGARIRRVGLLGGARTVRAGAHRASLRAWNVEVVSRIAQPLSAYVEAGELESARVVAEVTQIVGPLADLPAILLACTHYPAILPIFRAVLPGMVFLDPAERLADAVVAELLPPGRHTSRGPGLVVLTTGDPDATRTAARLAFGIDVGEVARISFSD